MLKLNSILFQTGLSFILLLLSFILLLFHSEHTHTYLTYPNLSYNQWDISSLFSGPVDGSKISTNVENDYFRFSTTTALYHYCSDALSGLTFTLVLV